MKKFFSFIIVLLLCLSVAFAFSSCNADDKNNEVHAHNFSVENPQDDFLKTAASCQSKAIYYKSCECGMAGTETFEYGTLENHSYDQMVIKDQYFASVATCTSQATYYYSCKCGAAGTESFSIGDNEQHVYENYICKSCGYETSSEGLELEYNQNAGWWEITGYNENLPENVHIANYNGTPIGAIGGEAFQNCQKIKTLYLSDTVTNFWGADAFSGCDNLESVYFGKNVIGVDRNFVGCNKLTTIQLSAENDDLKLVNNCIIQKTTITLPSGNTEEVNTLALACNSSVITDEMDIGIITERVFSGLTAITEIHLPDSVILIGERAFADCVALEEITIGKNTYHIDPMFIDGCVSLEKIHYNATSLYGYAPEETFCNAGSTSGITLIIGKDVEKIPASLFSNNFNQTPQFPSAINLKHIVFAENSKLEKIEACAFYNTAVVTISAMPQTLETIGQQAFMNCTELVGVDFGNAFVSLGESCFERCSSLENLTLNKNVIINSRAFALCIGLEEVEFPTGMISIGEASFLGCSGLLQITLPEGMKTVGHTAFAECSKVESITVSTSITTIGLGAFYNCLNLEDVYFKAANVADFATFSEVFQNAGCNGSGIRLTIGATVERVPAYMFLYNDALISINFEEGSTCKSIGERAFEHADKVMQITLPESLETVESNAFSVMLLELYNPSQAEIHASQIVGVLYVHTSKNSPSKLVYDGDYIFFVNEDDVRLVRYIGSAEKLTLPSSFNESAYSIHMYAFTLNETVKSIVVPSNVVGMSYQVFEGVQEIFCEASERPSGWDTSWCEEDAVVYWYRETSPIDSGNYWHYVNGEIKIW